MVCLFALCRRTATTQPFRLYHSKPILKPQRLQRPTRRDPISQSGSYPPKNHSQTKGAYERLRGFVGRRKNLLLWWCVETVCIYVYAGVEYYRHTEEAPISGRIRYAGRPGERQSFAAFQDAATKAVHDHRSVCEDCQAFHAKHALPDDDPLVQRVQNIFRRVAAAAGEDSNAWNLTITKQPGMQDVLRIVPYTKPCDQKF